MMFTNAFVGKPIPPNEQELATILGRSKAVWDELARKLATRFGPLTREWKCYSRNAGWTLRLLQRKRALLYLSPSSGFFGASVVLGSRALQQARCSDLPDEVIGIIDSATRYTEGTSIWLDVYSSRDADIVLRLVAFKLDVPPNDTRITSV